MKEVPISEFKAKCLALLEMVRRSGDAIVVTRRGKPVAEIIPPPPEPRAEWLGSLRVQGRVKGDVVSPAGDPDDWESLR